ncbi:MAG: hypothetical protein KGQ66_03830 [Acidobacteriota bacterium]|nr:hypothetical protein [Acidobacteriota bacterium]
MAVRHPEFVLAAAVAVSLPMAPGLLSGQISGMTAIERFLIALIVCWFLGSILSWVLTTYGEQARRAQVIRMIEESQRMDNDVRNESDS